MRIALCVLLFASLAASTFSQEDVGEERARKFTRETWASCAACHAAPDARVEHDERWIGLNATTACLTGEAASEDNRKRLMAYLEAGDAPLPMLVRPRDEAAREATPVGEGSITLPTTAGSAFLRRTDTKDPVDVRLVWQDSKEGAVLDLPSGTYTLISYSFYRTGDDGREWTASATVQEGQAADTLAIEHKKRTDLAVTPRIFHDLHVEADGPDLDITFQKRNDAGDRATLTCDGELVESAWVLYDEDGGEKATGPLAPT